MKNKSFLSKLSLYFKKEWLALSIFILVIIISQALILKSHLEFGFSPDDVWSFSDFSSFGPNPFLKFTELYKTLGSHFLIPIFYNGILFSFFGFNYEAYHITALIFKIFSIISFYLLIQIVFRNRLLSFISGLIYSFHYGSVGSMEMIARTQDYLVVAGINIFFIFFYLISIRKLKNILWVIICSLILFSSFIINPIRAYPVFPLICLLAIFQFLTNRTAPNFFQIIKNLTIIFLPFIFIFGLLKSDLATSRNTMHIIENVTKGNLQMLLSPFSSFGSLFIFGDYLKPFSLPVWKLDKFIGFFLQGPLIIFSTITFLFAQIISRKPLRFFLLVTSINFFLEFLVFLAINHGEDLPTTNRIVYDAYTFTPPAILGIYIIILTIFVFIEWIWQRQNAYIGLYILGICFAITFIWFTWIFQDIYSIPLGIYGYTTIPSMGISAAMGSILLLAYTKLRLSSGILKSLAPSVFLILIPYFLFSNGQIQTYLTKKIVDGNSAKDQIYLTDKFWQSIDKNDPCNKLIYLSTTDTPNGYYYDFIMIDRFDKWYSLYSPYHSKRLCPVAVLLNNEEKLLTSRTSLNGKEGFNYYVDEFSKFATPNSDYTKLISKFSSLNDFYAFRLQNREITDIRNEILAKVKQWIPTGLRPWHH